MIGPVAVGCTVGKQLCRRIMDGDNSDTTQPCNYEMRKVQNRVVSNVYKEMESV